MSVPIRERLARALFSLRVSAIRGKKWEELPPTARVSYLKDADAVLTEMREPSEGMLKAARRLGRPGIPPTPPEDYWRAMMQHAIDGGS